MENLLSDFDCFRRFNDNKLYCRNCDQVLVFNGKSSMTQHVKTQKHMQSLEGCPDKIFYEDLCNAFVSANIPLTKLNNTIFKNFLCKYTKRKIPDESTIRKHYIQNQYDKAMTAIKTKISSKYIWVSADETTDIKGRCVVNVVVGLLSAENTSQQYLVSSVFRETVNAEMIYEIVKRGLNNVIDNDVSKVLLFISDAASVMLKTGKLLQEHFPNMLHVTCLAHALHRVCEFIRDSFPDINSLISCFKKILLKAPSRVSLYKEICPNIPLPPQPVITRWGTWLQAVFFFSEHFDRLKVFISNLSEDALSITQCKGLITKTTLQSELNFLATYFSCLPETIKFLETRNLQLSVAMEKFESTLLHLKNVKWPLQDKFNHKIDCVIKRNPNLQTLKQISLNNFNDYETALKYCDFVPHFSFAPVTSCDVERSFSRFKDLLTSKRSNFTEDNLEKYAVIQTYFSNEED